EKLRLMESHFPDLEPHQILIEVYAADINPVDIKIESGAFGDKPLNFPYTPGSDVAGIVRDVGAKVSKFQAGDEIFGFIDVRRGGYSEFVASSPEFFILKPATASMVEAA